MQNSNFDSDSDSKLILLKASWVVPVSRPPLRNGAILIDGETIGAVLTQEELARHEGTAQHLHIIDYGDAVIMPGLINLHTHLDNSAMQCFDNDSSLFAWIEGLMRFRANWTKDEWWQSTIFGVEQAALSGTSLVVDSSYSGLSLAALAHFGLRGFVGLELFGLKDEEADPTWKAWLERAQSLLRQQDPALKEALRTRMLKLTVAPHAPYTVCPALWSKASAWAEENDLPLFAHLSESLDECQWLAGENQTIDNFHDFIRSARGADKVLQGNARAPWRTIGASPVSHLHRHGLLNERLVAAHAVHLDDSDIELLRSAGSKVAHCPRSNARLRNGCAPLNKLLAAQVTVGLGTDSLASCDDLNMRQEALFAVNVHRAIDPHSSFGAERALESVTLQAARALSLDDRLGSLDKGKLADVAVFSLPPAPTAVTDNPYYSALNGHKEVRDLIIGGKFIVKGGVIRRERHAAAI